jgi:putative tryptophan/tyrosine transport system substrate-binding protein
MRLVLAWLTGALSALVLPLSALETTQRPLVAVLDTDPPAQSRIVQILRAGLRDLGYIEGQNIRIVVRSADGQNKRLPTLVGEIVALKPKLIVSINTATTRALEGMTGEIPVVMGVNFAPLSVRGIRSLARPGGTFTGLSSSGRDLFAKRIELLKELLPGARRILLLWTPIDSGTPDESSRNAFEAVRSVAAPAGIEVISMPVQTSDELRNAFMTAVSKDVDAFLVLRGGIISISQHEIIEFATQHLIPTMFTDPMHVAEGGLIGYGLDIEAHARRVAIYVDKILKGANPAHLPVEQPTTFKLVVNLRTARALALTIPTSILIRADEVIE